MKDKLITIRCDEEEYQQIMEICKNRGIARSAFIREQIIRGLNPNEQPIYSPAIKEAVGMISDGIMEERDSGSEYKMSNGLKMIDEGVKRLWLSLK